MADEKKQADPDAQAEDGDGAAEDGAEGTQSKKRRFRLPLSPKKLLLIGAPVLLLIGGGYVGASQFGLLPVGTQGQAEKVPSVYFDLPELVVNLSAPDKRVQYLKLKVSLEASNRMAIDALTPVMPRVLDMFQLYLRELRASDLEGSAGIFRLKEELLRRINLEIHPKEVDRVLFKEIIIQ